MNELHARAIAGWRYDPPYDIYNVRPGDAKGTVQVYLDPEYAYHAILAAEGELVAYCCFGVDAQVPGGDYHAPALDVGLGVRPDLTGQGQGGLYVQAVLEYARCAYSPPAFRVTIAEFNKRALRVWAKAGFQRVQRFGRKQDGWPFLVLVRQEGGTETEERRDGSL
jgi:GNAT superfamily N-acetyltransferase